MGRPLQTGLDTGKGRPNQLSVNSQTIVRALSQDRFVSLLKLMQKLKTNPANSEKIWFFKVADFFKSEGLRMYSLPFEGFTKSVKTRGMAKMPDPKKFLVGVNLVNHLLKRDVKAAIQSNSRSEVSGYRKG